MNPLWQLVLARFKEFYREPSSIFWTFGFPVLLALALGLAFRDGGQQPAPVGVIEGPDAARMQQELGADSALKVSILSELEAEQQFLAGEVMFVIRGGDVPTYVFDPAHPQAEATRHRVDDRLQRAAGRKDALITQDEPVATRGARYIEFLIPGLLGMNIMSSSMWSIGWVVAESRRRKLLKRMMATPLRRSHFLASFVLARLVFLVAEGASIVAFGWLVFDVVPQGSLLAMTLLCLVGSMAFAGLSLLTACRSENPETVSGLMNLVIMPMFVLSGVFFSSALFPDWMQPAIKALPLTILVDALRAVVNQGASLVASLIPLGFLTAWMAASFALALRLFRWS